MFILKCFTLLVFFFDNDELTTLAFFSPFAFPLKFFNELTKLNQEFSFCNVQTGKNSRNKKDKKETRKDSRRKYLKNEINNLDTKQY